MASLKDYVRDIAEHLSDGEELPPMSIKDYVRVIFYVVINGGGGGGVSQTYVDTQDAETLTSANLYTQSHTPKVVVGDADTAIEEGEVLIVPQD